MHGNSDPTANPVLPRRDDTSHNGAVSDRGHANLAAQRDSISNVNLRADGPSSL